jgi:ABC-type multidrug transport system fused ATPase/permease subunit
VLLGGASILAGHITAEQLTKFILYSEWLIYSTWWVGDNLSSLMQSVGASEKVFQLMDLFPSDQFISKGWHTGHHQNHHFMFNKLHFPNC